MRPIHHLLFACGLFAIIACNGKTDQGDGHSTELVDPVANELGGPIPYPAVDDNVRHDTLLIQVTFDLRDGTYLMVASNVEETFEGVRLYHYRARPDSSADILAISAPAYDSWTMLPTLFGPGRALDGTWVLANFGERESWGQKVMWSDGGFTDRGFMDVAYPERIVETDTSYVKRTNVAPYMRRDQKGDTAIFTFSCDSVYLYDDQNGRMDFILPGNAIRYTYVAGTGLQLWVNGKARKTLLPPA